MKGYSRLVQVKSQIWKLYLRGLRGQMIWANTNKHSYGRLFKTSLLVGSIYIYKWIRESLRSEFERRK